jgi:hypothetical protein
MIIRQTMNIWNVDFHGVSDISQKDFHRLKFDLGYFSQFQRINLSLNTYPNL